MAQGVPEQRAIISGIGISRIGRRTGIPGLELTTESARAAIADAGLTPADIDGITTMGDTPLAETEAALALETRYRGGGYDKGGLLSPVMQACFAVASGGARHVLVYRTVQMMGGSIAPSDDADDEKARERPRIAHDSPMADAPTLMANHAYSAANWLAMHCQRHMHEHGTTREQLGWLAVTSRRYAGLNPLAAYREPITLDDYLNARWISTPFGLLDCDVPVDGSIAVVVSAADHAADCPHRPLRVEAVGGDAHGGWYDRPDYPKMASVDAAAEMWSRTELTPSDVDIAQLYDGFTFITLAWLEALGLCGEGQAGPFLEGGERIWLDGELPLNTYGGQLSAGRMHGYWVLHEACLQLRGDAGERQVARQPEVAAVAAGGGPFAGCMLLTR
ncbi:MAG: thiolase family protein [Pseudomonadota bacterium]